jgi:hypothetical protein
MNERKIAIVVICLLVATTALAGDRPILKGCIYTIQYGTDEWELWEGVTLALYLMGAWNITDNDRSGCIYPQDYEYTITYTARKPITKVEIAEFIDGAVYKTAKANQRIDELSKRVDELSRKLYELIRERGNDD